LIIHNCVIARTDRPFFLQYPTPLGGILSLLGALRF
jgi:hypothetical protein